MRKHRIVALSLLAIFIITQIPAEAEKEIVFAISPMASPASTIASYSTLIEYLSRKTGIDIKLKQRRKYVEINELLKSGEAEFALTCTGAYLSGREDFNLEVLAVPVINGKTTYHSFIIVNRNSDVKVFEGLKGKVFAYTDPLSLSGRAYPLYLLARLDEKEDTFFSKTFYTSSHEKSVESVAYGFADAAAVDSLIFDDMKRRHHRGIAQVRVIKVSPSYGIPPIVVSPSAPKELKQKMVKALLGMVHNHSGVKALRSLQIDKFVYPAPTMYANAVKMRRLMVHGENEGISP